MPWNQKVNHSKAYNGHSRITHTTDDRSIFRVTALYSIMRRREGEDNRTNNCQSLTETQINILKKKGTSENLLKQITFFLTSKDTTSVSLLIMKIRSDLDKQKCRKS